MGTVKNLPTVTRVYRNHLRDSSRWQYFRPRADDIVIATCGKSGTNWVQAIVRQLVFLHREIPADPLDHSLWLDWRWESLVSNLANLEAPTHRRFIKTHLALDGLPYFPQVKYIVAGRDGRDVFMSLWNHYSNYTPAFYESVNAIPGRIGPPFPPCPGDIHAFWRMWSTRGWFSWESEGYPFWGHLHHTRTWWEYRHLENILFVHFSDLLRDVANEIRRVADFLEVEVSPQDVATIGAAVSLEASRNRAKRWDREATLYFRGGADAFYFKGTNGRWRDVLTAAELELYDRAVERNLSPDAAAWLEHA